MTDEELHRLVELESRATPGPWAVKAHEWHRGWLVQSRNHRHRAFLATPSPLAELEAPLAAAPRDPAEMRQEQADALFMAELRNAARWLLQKALHKPKRKPPEQPTRDELLQRVGQLEADVAHWKHLSQGIETDPKLRARAEAAEQAVLGWERRVQELERVLEEWKGRVEQLERELSDMAKRGRR